MYAQPYPTAHSNTVHKRDVGLLVSRDEMVETVFESEVVDCFLHAFRFFLFNQSGETADVAPGAEGFFTGAFEDYDVG